MSYKINNAKHVGTVVEEPLHKRLRSRAVATLTAGCLALSVCPMVAMASPGDTAQPGGGAPAMEQVQSGGDMQMPGGDAQMPASDLQFDGTQAPGDNMQAPEGGMQTAFDGQQPPADMQAQDGTQANADGQAPAGMGAPDGQAPAGMDAPNGQAPAGMGAPGEQPGGMPGDNAMDDQVRTYIYDEYGIAAPADMQMADGQQPTADGQAPGDGAGLPQQMGDPSAAPEIPEGEVNVQATIDSVRDVVGEYGVEALEAADFADDSWTSSLAQFVQAASAQRVAQFASGEAQAGMPAAGANAQAPGADNQGQNAQAPEKGEAPEAPASGLGTLSETLLGNLVTLIAGLF